MNDRDSVINDLNAAKLILCNPQILTPEMCIRIGQAITSAIALLKEQEAVEPDTDSEGTLSCGNCGETVGYFPAGCSIPLKFCKFCPECGKKVKWE